MIFDDVRSVLGSRIMNNIILFRYVAENRNHVGITAFESWIDNSDSFYRFVSVNSDNIREEAKGTGGKRS